jgi:hypothetical protein
VEPENLRTGCYYHLTKLPLKVVPIVGIEVLKVVSLLRRGRVLSLVVLLLGMVLRITLRWWRH